AALADGCSNIVGEIADLQRAEARRQAWMVELIDEARRASEASLHGVRVLGSTLSEARRQEMARRSLVAELACALLMPETTVIGMLTDAEALIHRLPATMTALRAGEITYKHAKVLVDQTATLSPEAALLLEEQAVPFGRSLTVSKFRAKTRLLREHLDPDSVAARVAKSAQDRRLDFQPADDGMAWLSLYTTAPEATSIYTAVRDHALAVRTPADPRTLTQLSADVFTDAVSAALCGELPAGDGGPGDGGDQLESPGDLSDDGQKQLFDAQKRNSTAQKRRSGFGSGAAFRRIRPTVTVTIPAMTLLGRSEEPGTLEGYGPIDADTARELAGQSNVWYRMLTDPTAGVPVALDRTKYKPTKKMKQYLRCRDGTCRFPGCNRTARHCDLDHTNDHAHGGPTECDNLAHLCRKHHRLKHQTTWQVQQRGNGVLEWTSPGGRTYTTQPETYSSPHLQAPDEPESAPPPPAEAETGLDDAAPF
ncbi:HNH endonuclease signature motif containing protein, partial [Mycetocola miduiensis]